MKNIVILMVVALPIFASGQANDPENIVRQNEERQKQKDNANQVPFPIDSATGKPVFTGVVSVQGASSDVLYSRAKYFIAEAYKSSKAVTQLNDDAAKTILIKPIIPNHVKGFLVGNMEYGYTSYQLVIECKDNRFRYTASGFYHHAEPTGANSKVPDGGDIESEKGRGFTKPTWRQVQQQVYDDMILTVQLLKRTMLKDKSDF